MNTSTFLFLVKDEFRRRNSAKHSNKWWMFYVAAGILIGLIFAAVFADNLDPYGVMFMSFGFPYITFIIAFSIVIREWKNGTAGWWLTLPYPRRSLILSKYAASICTAVIMHVIFWVGAQLFVAYALILQGNFDFHSLAAFMKTSAIWYGVIMMVIPFMTAFGTLTGVVSRSRLKPLTPMLWIIYGLSGNSLFWVLESPHLNKLQLTQNPNEIFTVQSHEFGWIALAIILLSGILISAATVLMNKQVEG